MRIHTNELPFDLHSMAAPRYVANTIGYRFKNWRDLGESAVHTLPANIGPLTLINQVIEDPPITVLIDGETNKAARIQESVLMSGNSAITNNSFTTKIYTIACATRVRNSDIVVRDANNNVIATLYNTDTKTRYKVCDVSQVFWTI